MDCFGFKCFGPAQREIRDCGCLCSDLVTLKQFLFPLSSVLPYIHLDIPTSLRPLAGGLGAQELPGFGAGDGSSCLHWHFPSGSCQTHPVVGSG